MVPHTFCCQLVSPLSPFSQAWRDLTRKGELRAGDVRATTDGLHVGLLEMHEDRVCRNLLGVSDTVQSVLQLSEPGLSVLTFWRFLTSCELQQHSDLGMRHYESTKVSHHVRP